MKKRKTRALIIGCAGSIGSELVRQLASEYAVYGVDTNETGLFDIAQETGIEIRIGDIREENTVRDIFSDFRPQIVFHAAAYKHVPLMEKFPLEGIKTNILGLYHVLHYSKVYPIEKFIFISTDKAVDPRSVMGATKMVGEVMTKNQGKGFIVVRFGNVLGSRGSVIPIWQRQLDKNKPLTVTDKDMERYFMTIPQACELVIKAAEMCRGGETVVLDMGERVNVYKLAEKIIKESGVGAKIEIIGKRPGEQLIEKIMSFDEEKRALKKDKFYVIQS